MLTTNNQVFIFAAGYGKRLLPITASTPKPLIKIGGLCLIEHTLIKLAKAGFTKVTINVSHLAEHIMNTLGNGTKYNMCITYAQEHPSPLETAGGLRAALQQNLLNTEQPILCINSDIFTHFDFATLRSTQPQHGHFILVPNPEHNTAGDFGLEQDRLINTPKHYTYSGICVLKPAFLLHNNQEKKLGNILRNTIAQCYLTGNVYNGYWKDIGTISRLETARVEFTHHNTQH